ncbi:protein of unknown function [Methylorubrum extorquens]|uniref:ISL3 family transposase n=1 Tax=Methylorubrum extorquens TaxID=408 RepID=A0A2N9AN89_METEX|nr:protein of unknown function [Methylorubrum extorquens]
MGSWRGRFSLADRGMTQLIPLPGCRLVRVARDGPTALTLVAEAKPDHARCPTCRAISTSVHSRYRRRPADLPASGKAVRLQLEVRRFYCCDPACPRRTFAERFPKLLARHAQRTRRLAGAQARTGLALGGQPAARLLAHLAMPSSATTLLRTIRGVPLPKAPRPCVVGVDDWALRKGRTYGTIVVDLERHRPLDLLPDRSAETWAAWLRCQPQIRLVARDRSTEYARGTTLGAPAAVQVADRWHLLLNTRQMIERWLARVHPRLKLLPPITAPAPSTRRTRAYPRAPAETLARAAAVGRWEELYDDVRRRRAAGQSLRLINRETGLARATVRKYAFAEGFPRHDGRGPGRSILDPHLDHLHARQAAGARTPCSSGASCGIAAFPAPSSRSDAGCPSGARAPPGPRSGASRRRRPWRRSRPRRRRCPRRSSCRGTSCASRMTSTPTPQHWSRACCRMTRLPRSSGSVGGSVESFAAVAAPRRPSPASPPPSTLGCPTPVPAVCGWSRASPSASLRMEPLFVQAFACPGAADRTRGRSTASSC